MTAIVIKSVNSNPSLPRISYLVPSYQVYNQLFLTTGPGNTVYSMSSIQHKFVNGCRRLDSVGDVRRMISEGVDINGQD